MAAIQQLVERAMSGDHDAFASLASIVGPKLFSVATLITRDHHIASDAAQETLIHIWRDLPTLRDAASFDGWAHRILVRRCYAGLRARRWRTVDVHALQVEPTVPSDEERVAINDQLERAFSRLTADQRTVVVLRHKVGLSEAQTARVLGIPIGTVKSRLNRAHAAMRAALDADARRLPAMKGQLA